jgi:arylsulfatase A-like enzyme
VKFTDFPVFRDWKINPKGKKFFRKSLKVKDRMDRPNILFILVDELRYPTTYESKELHDWSKKHLKGINFLRKYGVDFRNHYIGATACAPSRTTIFTGQYPSLHGVASTDGAAKYAYDPDMYWLDESTVPTLGDYFEAAGYQTFYKGKWHISEADITVPGTHDPYASFNEETGAPDPSREKVYLAKDRLSKYGLHDWIGPEPHGPDPRLSGSSAASGVSGRDVVFASEVSELIASLDKQNTKQPWLMVSSFVNPHDITLFGEVSRRLPGFNFEVDPSVPPVPPAPTANEDLSTKPVAQESYKQVYQQAFQPTIDDEHYRRLYYSLQLHVDRHIQTVLTALKESKFVDNTIVVFTSDHGDLLGAHGLFQKWHNAYQETVHVPFSVLVPGVQHKSHEVLTSHVDLVPTLLGLAGIDPKEIQKKLFTSYSEVHHFVGRDLSQLILNGKCIEEEPIYFMTDDEVTKGLNQTTIFGQPYEPVIQPNHLETVVARIGNKLYKLSRYFSNPQFAGQPDQGDTPTPVEVAQAEAVPNQTEMYNITDDPLETQNLTSPSYATKETEVLALLLWGILQTQNKTKRLYPRSGSTISPFSPDIFANRNPRFA